MAATRGNWSGGGTIVGLFWCALGALGEVAYTSCAPGRYGPSCDGLCACSKGFVCHEGPAGTGACGEPPARARLTKAAELLNNPESGMRRLEERWVPLWVPWPPDGLPKDPVSVPFPRQVAAGVFSEVSPTPFRAERLRLVAAKADVLSRVGVDATLLQSEALVEVLAGRAHLPSSPRPWAHLYGGDQFGVWAGQLGDGRSITLGVLRDVRHEARPALEVALKGSGRTPYSRGGDGRSVLANAVRELLADSFLVHVGVPAARTAAVIAAAPGEEGKDAVLRDEWYTGRPQRLPAAILVRMAPSFLRFGTVQVVVHRQPRALPAVVRHALDVLHAVEAVDDESARALPLRAPSSAWCSESLSPFSERQCPASPLAEGNGALGVPRPIREQCFFVARKAPSCAARARFMTAAQRSLCLLTRVSTSLAALVASWMAVGFAHGVMNTDNCALIPTTLDMNVYGFVHRLDKGWTPNYIDRDGRYAFGQQPEAALWNLRRLGAALEGRDPATGRLEAPRFFAADDTPFLSTTAVQTAIANFSQDLERCYRARLSLRLALPQSDAAEVRKVVDGWLQWLEVSGANYHAASYALARAHVLHPPSSESLSHAAEAVAEAAGVTDKGHRLQLERWLQGYQAILLDRADTTRAVVTRGLEHARRRHIRGVVPSVVPWTSAVRGVMDAASQGNDDVVRAALHVLSQPLDAGGSVGQARADAGVDGPAELLRLAWSNFSVLRGDLAHARGMQTSCGGQ